MYLLEGLSSARQADSMHRIAIAAAGNQKAEGMIAIPDG